MRTIVLLLFMVMSNLLIAQNYYEESLQQLSGQDLRTALHDLIDDHIEYSYSQCKTILKESDEDPLNANNLLLVYKQNSIDKDDFAYAPYDPNMFDYWNREHVWAKSLGDFGPGGVFENGPAHTDAHNLKPCDMTMNSDRGNKSFDNGGVSHAENENCRYTNMSWEAPDNVKGDIARILFYMDLRYEGGFDEPDLSIVDYLDTYPNPEIGNLSTLLEWHILDPVDEFEMNRNEVIYSWQNNRNPFIDHPEFVEMIWGSDVIGESDEIPNLFFSEYIEGSFYNKALELYNASSQSVDLAEFELWQISNGGTWYEQAFDLGGVLESGETVVIAHANADTLILAASSFQANINFNGNDALALVYQGQVIDKVGVEGEAPVTGWAVAGQLNATQNKTLVRKSTVQSGNTDWALSAGSTAENSEWLVKEVDDISGLGMHNHLHSQEFEIPNGWFMLGLNVVPEENTMELLFSSIIEHLVVVKNVDGNVFLPEWGFNSIEALDIGEGLLVKVDAELVLTVQGEQIDLLLNPLQIPVGWSMKSYLKEQAISVFELTAHPDIIIIKDYLGNASLPALGFNGIVDFQPGQSYLVKSAAELTIPWE